MAVRYIYSDSVKDLRGRAMTAPREYPSSVRDILNACHRAGVRFQRDFAGFLEPFRDTGLIKVSRGRTRFGFQLAASLKVPDAGVIYETKRLPTTSSVVRLLNLTKWLTNGSQPLIRPSARRVHARIVSCGLKRKRSSFSLRRLIAIDDRAHRRRLPVLSAIVIDADTIPN